MSAALAGAVAQKYDEHDNRDDGVPKPSSHSMLLKHVGMRCSLTHEA